MYYQRWIFLRKTNISAHPQKWPCTGIQGHLVTGQYYFCTKPKKGNFSAHNSNISARTPKINVISMHNRIRNSPNLHFITHFNVLPTFSWLKGSFELSYSNTYHWIHISVLRAEAPTRAEFLQKRLISAFFGFQWQNLAEILHLFKKYNYPRKVAVRE